MDKLTELGRQHLTKEVADRWCGRKSIQEAENSSDP